MKLLIGNVYIFLFLTIIMSFLAFPVSYFIHFIATYYEMSSKVIPFYYLTIGYLVLGILFLIGLKLTKYADNKSDWIVAGMIVFLFTCVIDFIDWLEYIRAIKSFMTLYLLHCEPYLYKSWGAAISLFDMIGFLPMYIWMIFQRREKKSSSHLIGLYWCGGILNLMFVEIIGAVASKFPISVAILLNVPYFVLPFAVFNTICQELRCKSTPKVIPYSQKSWKLRFLELFLVVALTVAAIITVSKAMCALGSNHLFFQEVVKNEPFLYLEDPAPFGKIQVLIMLVFILPIQCFCIKDIATGKSHMYLPEVSLFYAGVMFSCQFCYMYGAFDKLSHPDFITDLDNVQFWILNLFIVAVPHILVFRNEVVRKLSIVQDSGNIDSEDLVVNV